MTMTSVHPRCPLPGWQSPGPARRPTSDQRTRGGSGRRRNPGVRGSVPTRTHVATAPAERRRSGLGAFAGTCAAAAAAVAARAEVTELATTTWPGPCRPLGPSLCRCPCSAFLGARMALAEDLPLMDAGPS